MVCYMETVGDREWSALHLQFWLIRSSIPGIDIDNSEICDSVWSKTECDVWRRGIYNLYAVTDVSGIPKFMIVSDSNTYTIVPAERTMPRSKEVYVDTFDPENTRVAKRAFEYCQSLGAERIIIGDCGRISVKGYSTAATTLWLLTTGRTWYEHILPVQPVLSTGGVSKYIAWRQQNMPPFEKVRQAILDASWESVKSVLKFFPDVLTEIEGRYDDVSGQGSLMKVLRQLQESCLPWLCDRCDMIYERCQREKMSRITTHYDYVWVWDKVALPTIVDNPVLRQFEQTVDDD